MRIRSIKPEFWRSDDITSLGWDDRLIFIGLWSYVDDNGVGLDKLASVAADLFAGDLERDSSETFARVSRGLQNLSEAGRIARYTVDGKKYLHVTNWEKHQRIDKPNKPRYPLPTSENAEATPQFATPSRDIRETPATGTEEQGNRGTEEVKTCPNPSDDDDFIEFYLAYPRHEGRGTASKAYVKARKKASREAILAGAERYAADPNREAQFTKLPATWLNAESWEDAPLPARASNVTNRSEDRMRANIASLQNWQPTQQINPFEQKAIGQ